MKIVKKNIKLLIGIIIGILIGGSVVIAESIIEANHIKYSNSKTEKTNVQDAIDELYDLSKNLKYNNFAEIILKNNQVINKEPTLTTSSNNTSDESGLYKSTATNSGSSTYYFRGNVENNYVSFAGFIWRIVRINEDGTVRIIMQDGINNNALYKFNSNKDNYKYMYYSNSEAKTTLENWYQSNIGNKTELSNNIAIGNYFCEQAKVKRESRFTSANSTMTLYTNYVPNFKCITDGNAYDSINSSIGLITYDEFVYAGGYQDMNNPNLFFY